MTVIAAHNVVKSFGKHIAVNKLSLEIKRGEIFGLLGPNAAGKTTSLRLLCGLLKADSGEITIAGLGLKKNLAAIKKKIGYIAQYFGLYQELTVLENLHFYAKLYGIKKTIDFDGLLEQYQLTEFRNQRAGQLSGGYKRRLSLVCALAHDPEIIFLDEPTAGIDPVTRKSLWDIFYSLSTSGKTLLVTTHYMEEAQRCNRIGFLNHGQMITRGRPDEIQNSLTDHVVYVCYQKFLSGLTSALNSEIQILLVNQFGNELRIIAEKSMPVKKLQSLMTKYIDGEVMLEQGRANLEDIFIALTQNPNRYEVKT